MTSLSNVIKRYYATPLEPQRIDSKPFLEPVSVEHDDQENEQLEQKREQLRLDEEALQSRRASMEQELAVLREEVLTSARQEGFDAGFDHGRREGKAEYDELMTRLNTVAVELEQLFDTKWRDAERQLVALALEVSARVTTELVRKDEALFADRIREQLLRQLDAESLTVYVHPTRLASIQRFDSEWATPDGPPLKYRADAGLSETSVRIETPHHGDELDLTYSFERIQSKIEEVLADGAY
ncbi:MULTISPECIES: FliH/SctL family protein [Exiguobacterium]|uniref:FliH/SctL family protein n=1 Tax=Exiguobacterium TaxID=33986 RepID=UPI001BE915F8|nr:MULTISPECIES: FliH/SctL family protein [unclassified Exiguobacterium]